MNNWYNMYDYHGDKNKNNKKEYKGIDKDALEKYRDKVENYFDLEVSIERPLIEIVCDSEGNAKEDLISELSDIVLSHFLQKDSVNNCAMAILDYISTYGY